MYSVLHIYNVENYTQNLKNGVTFDFVVNFFILVIRNMSLKRKA